MFLQPIDSSVYLQCVEKYGRKPNMEGGIVAWWNLILLDRVESF